MAGSPSVYRPTLHPSNTIHRPVNNFQQEEQTMSGREASGPSHEIWEAGLFIGAAISGFIVYRIL